MKQPFFPLRFPRQPSRNIRCRLQRLSPKWIYFPNVKDSLSFHIIFTRIMALILLFVRLVLNSVASQERKNKTIDYLLDLPLVASGYILKRILKPTWQWIQWEKDEMLRIIREVAMELLSVISHLSLGSCHFSSSTFIANTISFF